MTPIVERLARVLGVWVEPNEIPSGAFCVGWAGDAWRICYSTTWSDFPADEPTALLALLAYARGLVVDMGPCPACAERGGGWDWAWRYWGSDESWHTGPAGMGGSDPLPQVSPDVQDGWRGEWLPNWSAKDECAMVRPCPACSVDGQPTGRDVRPLVRVLLDSMPQRTPDTLVVVRPEGPASDGDPVFARVSGPGEIGAMRNNSDGGRAVEVKGTRFEVRGSSVGIRSLVPGDPASRERLAVRADELAQAGDLLAEPLAAFLGGECRTCEGDGGCEVCSGHGLVNGYSNDVQDCTACDGGRCQDCRGHGTMLGALSPALEEMAAEEWQAWIREKVESAWSDMVDLRYRARA